MRVERDGRVEQGAEKLLPLLCCTKHTNINVPGKSLHETFGRVLHQLSLRKDQIAKIRKAAACILENVIRGRSKRMEALKSSLTELEKKINGLEEKVVNDEIEAATCKKWFGRMMTTGGKGWKPCCHTCPAFLLCIKKQIQDGRFRTASINPDFAHNVLKIKKGLLIVEQPGEILSDFETCRRERHNVELYRRF